ncbi:GNAT family N-acetyltransferase [Micromonospora sp. NBS 11-29]|uniref:GNAT family N-acetyltransferase n=1 Tax=Micromonospora sp. NBS 11-29 TaxID=1960879 RepID=UPI000B796648|nr:GNAT family N-acetyltransferase [Micromonospora sp. NBS 11-29]
MSEVIIGPGGVDLEIWDARREADATRWAGVHAAWPAREVFAHPAYVRLFAGPRDEPLAAYARTEQGFVLYPFVLRPVDTPHLRDTLVCRDIISPYGYGGAFQHAVSDVEAKAFWHAFDGFCATRRVVSEFSRLSLFPDQRLAPPGPTEQKLMNVVCDLRATEDEMWREFDHKVRKNVNKARRSGVTIEVDLSGVGLDDFLRIYEGTMDRRRATAGFYFPRSFFQTIIDELPGQFVFFHARHDGRVVSTELVLVSGSHLYSFLGGTEQHAFGLRPNDLLKFEIMRWGRAQGRTRFVLGGGYQDGDGIFRYKRAFAPDGLLPFSVCGRVLDRVTYARLNSAHCREARRRDPSWAPSDEFFPEYRQPLPADPEDD